MKFLCWNVNGLRSVYQKNFIEVLTELKPDILAVQEIKSRCEDLSAEQCSPLGYLGEFNSAKKLGYSGVATFFRDSTLLPKKTSTGIGNTDFDDEGRFLISVYPNFTFYNIYFPSGTSGELRQGFKYRFLDALSEHIKNLPADEKKRLIICGDFNICHRAIDIHHPIEAEKRRLTGFLPEERAWFSSFLELGFIDAFRALHGDIPKRYTWWSFRANARAKNLGWRIDYFLISKELLPKLKAAELLPQIKGSDHCPLVLEMDL